jgi:ribokinase
MKPKILVIGSSNTDMIVKLPYLPGPGETVLGSDFIITQGGKGANQAVASARAGGEVIFISCLGDDLFGESTLRSLRNNGIDTSFIKIIHDVPSGIALINVSQKGENSISVAPGANSHLQPSDIIDQAEIIAAADIILVQLEIPLETVETAIELAMKYGKPLILNPAPARSISPEVINNVTIITPNEKEACMLLGIDQAEDSYISSARLLRKLGIDTVIITLGGNGAYYSVNGVEKHMNGYKVDVLDTTAAGDTFNGYLAVSIAGGDSIEKAIKIANRAASLSVTKYGAQDSIPYIEEVLRLLGNDKN